MSDTPTDQFSFDLPDAKPIRHLRAVLVATGALPPRDEQLTRLERWITRVIAERPDPGQQQLLHRYAVWHVIRRLRSRLGGTHATHGQLAAAQQNIKAAVALLDWLAAHDLTLTTARQGDLEAWLASTQATHRTDAGNFVRWAKKQTLAQLDFPAVRWGGPTGVIDAQLAERLRQLGVRSGQSRSAALFQLATDLPAAVLARMLGIHITVAGAWQRASAGDWAVYATEVSRRSIRPHQPDPGDE